MNMPSRSGNSVHQIIGEHPAQSLEELTDALSDSDFIIVDEAQNTTIHELKTIITRTGKNSKIVLLGDTDQIDTPYIDSYSNGLTISVEKLKSSHLTSHITLERGERSELATLAGQML
jgi:PhoH-like ATPase